MSVEDTVRGTVMLFIVFPVRTVQLMPLSVEYMSSTGAPSYPGAYAYVNGKSPLKSTDMEPDELPFMVSTPFPGSNVTVTSVVLNSVLIYRVPVPESAT